MILQIQGFMTPWVINPQGDKKINIMEDLYGYHVVLTTHNSRTSQRMMNYNIIKGDPLLLDLEQEIQLTKIIGAIIVENDFKCIAYNICKDHLHLLLVCQENELIRIVQKLKSISSKRFNRSGAISSQLKKYHHNHLWSQKFYRAELDEWQWAHLSKKPGDVYRIDHLTNSIDYIRNNREKHHLKESDELTEIITSFLVTMEEAYQME